MKPIRKLFLLFLFLFISVAGSAQDYDFGTVEALITDHKSMRTRLIARSMIEYENMLQHQIASGKTIEYDSLGKRLDNYIRCFEIIELIYTGGKIFFNAKNTYDDVVNKYIPRLTRLNETYVERCLAKGNIMTSDSIIIRCYESMINAVLGQSRELITSVYDIAMYTTGTAACTRPELINIMRRINNALESMRTQIRNAYFVLWKYITIRTTFWRKSIYRAKSMKDICTERFEIWKEAARNKR